MPVPKNISPLLDNIVVGASISDHNGIRCFPAIHKETNEKYILKVISVPSSQTQLDAMLLTGALENEDAAQKYYAQRADELVRKIDVLQQLSRQEGFLPYAGCQVVAKEESVGYDIYILSRYKRSLQRQITQKPMTQLEALNLGLDICSALTACRRSGYLFMNLKPSNIFIGDNGEYRIRDFGLISLNSLHYATLPEHYISSYTAPEITDVFSSLNETVDVYAIGMILYGIYNGGALPEQSESPLPAPAYADDELSQIILKACSINPEDRWQDPAQMGQMLVSYIQKNGAFDTPIVPPAPEPEPEPQQAEELEIETAEQISIDEIIGSIEDAPETATSEQAPEEAAEDAAVIMPDSIEPEQEPDTDNTEETQAEETKELPQTIAEDTPEAEASGEEIDDGPEDTADSDEPIIVDAEAGDDGSNDTAREEEALQQEASVYEGISEEVSQILSQADALAELDVPEPVVVPEAVEIDIHSDQEDGAAEDLPPDNAEEDTNMKKDEYFDDSYFNDESAPQPRSHWLRNIIIISILLVILIGGLLFYNLYVLKNVTSFELSGSGSNLTVMVTSDAEEALLTVSCADASRKVITVPVVNGKAEFTGLDASTEYTVTVEISGLHTLKGITELKYSTPAATSIVQYTVETGSTAGTVNIKFALNGPDSERWSFTYYAEEQQPKTESFVGHSFTLKGLEENTIYTGVLQPEKNLMITESLEITFTASELIRANDLRVISCSNGSLTAQWDAPESVTVESWFIRCYNENYDQTQNIKNTTATFHDLNSAEAFTVEVWAKGQTVKQTEKVAANSITIRDLSADLAAPGKVVLSWKATETPQGGWTVSYCVNDAQKSYSCSASANKVTIDPVAPGAKYTFTVSAADPAVSTFCDSFTCVIPEAEGDFSISIQNEEITAADLQVSMCKRPSASWTKNDLSDSSYTQSFKSGENAGFLVFLEQRFKESEESIEVLIVITDEDGGLSAISSSTLAWNSMWNQNYCTLNIPSTPKDIGCYVATVYFNNMLVDEFDFAIS